VVALKEGPFRDGSGSKEPPLAEARIVSLIPLFHGMGIMLK
jgi:hypothetical protein